MENSKQPITPCMIKGRQGFADLPTIPNREVYGLTKREYFAGLAMQGLLTRVPKRDNDKVDLGILELKRIVEESVLMANALLEELEKLK